MTIDEANRDGLRRRLVLSGAALVARTVVARSAAAATVAATSAAVVSVAPNRAFAQGAVRRTVRIIVPVTAGAGPDLIARILQPRLQARLQARGEHSVVVENRPGGAGTIAYEAVAKSPPDGTTLLVAPSAMTTVPHLHPKLPYDLFKSFTPITNLGSTGLALVVHHALPPKNVPEFVAYAKARPGELHYASPGNASGHHLGMELFKLKTGINLVHVPYKGAAGATHDLIAGRIPVMFLPIHLALPLLKAGQVRSLGVSLRERHPLFPDMPTLREQGVTDYDVDLWIGLWGPAGMAPELLTKLNADVRAIVVEPDSREHFARQGLIPNVGTPAAFAKLIRDDYERWGTVIRDAKITAD